MLQDNLNKEWKERRVRKMHFIDKGSMKASPMNFAEYPKSCTWTEMPNRYIKPEIPKVQIERIYHENLLKRAKSISEDPSSIPIVPITPNSASKRPFYYSAQNEILSVDEFFKAYKDVQSHRKKEAKIKFHQSIAEKRQKIEGLYSDRAVTAMNPSTIGNPSAISSLKPMSIRSSRKGSAPQFMVTSSVKYSSPFQESSRYNLSPRDLITPKNFDILHTEEALSQHHPTEPDKVLSTKESRTFRIETAPTEGFTTRQKFTEKEITRHLIRGTVCPKPAKHGGQAVEKEKAYISMFKAPEVMDYNVETTIKKAQKMLVNIETPKKEIQKLLGVDKDTELKKRLLLGKKSNMKGSQHHKSKDLREIAIEVAEDQGNCRQTGKKIQINIKNISMILSTTPRIVEENPRMESTFKRSVNQRRPKLKLRPDVEEKYNFNEKYQKFFTQQMQDDGKVMRNEAVVNAVSKGDL